MISFMSVIDFKTATGINLDDHVIETALVAAATRIKTIVFYKKSYIYATPANKFKLDDPIADYDMDGEVTVNDFEIYEFDKDDYINPETDRKTKVTNFNPKYGYIVMDDDYPKDGKKLVIDFYIARFENEIMKPHLRRLNLLMATDALFTNIPIERLQEGISSWSLNGVSISFDLNSIQSIKESLKSEIKSLMEFITPIIHEKTNLGFDLDDQRRRGFTFQSPGGNRYRTR